MALTLVTTWIVLNVLVVAFVLLYSRRAQRAANGPEPSPGDRRSTSERRRGPDRRQAMHSSVLRAARAGQPGSERRRGERRSGADRRDPQPAGS